MRRQAILGAATLAVVAAVAPAYAATGSPTPPPATPATPGSTGTRAATHAPTGSYSPPNPGPAAVAVTPHVKIRPSSRFHLVTDAKHRVKTSSWPNPATVFTADELRQVIPSLRAATANDCASSTGIAVTSHPTCTLTLRIPGEPADDRSRIVVSVREFGPVSKVGRQWAAELDAARQRAQARPGIYTFFRNGSLGVAASFTDGTTTHVLLTRGRLAGDIWFSGVGFTRLAATYSASRATYRTVLVPELVALLGAKMRPAAAKG